MYIFQNMKIISPYQIKNSLSETKPRPSNAKHIKQTCVIYSSKIIISL